MNNFFNTPDLIRNEILNTENIILRNAERNYVGKSFVCVFFTRFCGVGCPFCFFRSPQKNAANNIEDCFTDEGIDKFIEFANKANIGYLQISGGGEPFLMKKAILKSVEFIDTNRIMLVTSGMWASSNHTAEAYLEAIESAIFRRKTKSRVTVRLSVSEGHSQKLGLKPLINLIEVFSRKYRNHEYFTLQLKTFKEDNTLLDYLSSRNCKIDKIGKNESDDSMHKKVIPYKYEVTFEDGYKVIMGISRVFNPSMKPNLHDYDSIKDTILVYDKDVDQSENDYPSVVFNSNDKNGLDWIIEYNGNICTWQNRVNDNYLNIYEDKYEDIYDKTFADPLTLSYIEKGSTYRDNIISEITTRPVTLMKAVSVRDYAGNCLFEDEKVRLYYTVRVLQDYAREGRLSIDKLSIRLQEIINLSLDNLIALYKDSSYSIVDFEIKKNGNDPIKFLVFLELIKLGHFELKEAEIQKAVDHYNSIVCEEKKLLNVDDVLPGLGLDHERLLTNRYIEIKDMQILH
ncbi:MAG: 4Fe-4S cluster-binding domain-containing protein [Janthinobacterium lividum]